MTKRKRTRVYSFGGNTLEKLEERIAKCISKIDDPVDPDDKRWLERWLQAAQRRLEHKVASLESRKR